MRKYAYIGCSYQNRLYYQPFIETVKKVLHRYGWTCSIPVFDLSHIPSENHKQIMDESFRKLNDASLVIIEASEKNIGLGIEVGYARALHIPTAYFYKKGSEFSTTVAGTATNTTMYVSLEDVARAIETIITSIDEK